ncbi:hypothetical protein BH09PSE6_BH09PSE6_15050 [soil metagenome]
MTPSLDLAAIVAAAGLATAGTASADLQSEMQYAHPLIAQDVSTLIVEQPVDANLIIPQPGI